MASEHHIILNKTLRIVSGYRRGIIGEYLGGVAIGLGGGAGLGIMVSGLIVHDLSQPEAYSELIGLFLRIIRFFRELVHIPMTGVSSFSVVIFCFALTGGVFMALGCLKPFRRSLALLARISEQLPSLPSEPATMTIAACLSAPEDIQGVFPHYVKVREAAAEVLGWGGPAAVDLLMTTLSSMDSLQDLTIGGKAARSLGRLGDARALSVMERILDEETIFRKRLVSAGDDSESASSSENLFRRFFDDLRSAINELQARPRDSSSS